MNHSLLVTFLSRSLLCYIDLLQLRGGIGIIPMGVNAALT
jgi:hypothetical protein